MIKENKAIALITPKDVREFARNGSMLDYVIKDGDIFRALQSLKYAQKITENRVFNAFSPYHFWGAINHCKTFDGGECNCATKDIVNTVYYLANKLY